ncbi:hypothetical protein COBT_003092 [Conglomerata obtusa]
MKDAMVEKDYFEHLAIFGYKVANKYKYKLSVENSLQFIKNILNLDSEFISQFKIKHNNANKSSCDTINVKKLPLSSYGYLFHYENTRILLYNLYLKYKKH